MAQVSGFEITVLPPTSPAPVWRRPPATGRRGELLSLPDLHAAALAQRKLEIVYFDVEGEPSTRVIWPLAIGATSKARAIAAFCELRCDFRTFRLDRLAAAAETGAPYGGQRAALFRLWLEHFAPSRFTPDPECRPMARLSGPRAALAQP